MKLLQLILPLFLFNCCTYNKIVINKDEFNRLQKINYSDVTPSISNCCWVLVENGMSGWDSILYKQKNCEIAENEIKGKFIVGFDEQGLPVPSYKYIISYDKQKSTYWSTPDSLKLFLGEINNISEAQILTKGYNYFSSTESVYKIDSDGYLMVLYKLVKTGFPIQVDKFLLKVTKNGKIKIIAREVSSKIKNGII